jgi:hypothetical protein
MMSVCRAAAAD